VGAVGVGERGVGLCLGRGGGVLKNIPRLKSNLPVFPVRNLAVGCSLIRLLLKPCRNTIPAGSPTRFFAEFCDIISLLA